MAKIQENSLSIPRPQRLHGTNDVLPYVFVCDEASGISPNLLRPYSGRNLTTEERIFNYRLTRARWYAECAFGILSNKWWMFHRPLNVNVDFTIVIVKDCCVLLNNNYNVREREAINFHDTCDDRRTSWLWGRKCIAKWKICQPD